jgi:uncharacterized protein
LIYESFIPHNALIWQHPDIDLEELIPTIQEQGPKNDQTTLYICYRGVCEQPLTELSGMQEAIQKL